MKKLLCLALIVVLAACNEAGDLSISEPGNVTVGKGGSTTRFTIVDQYLYVVEESNLKTFDLTDVADPRLIDTIIIPDELETIFPYTYEGDPVLFLGAQNGMHVYVIGTDGVPQRSSHTVLAHQTSCDPVIVQDNYAYVTLRSSEIWGCNQGFNELHVNDVSNLNNIRKVGQSIPMDGPKGLSFSSNGTALLVCDLNNLKVFSLSDPEYPELQTTNNTIQCNDILEFNGNYIVTGDNVLKIYSFDEMTYELTFEFNLLRAQI